MYIFIKPNVFVKKKHKNARMGKGVGKIKKLFFFYKPSYPFLVTRYYDIRRVYGLFKFIRS